MRSITESLESSGIPRISLPSATPGMVTLFLEDDIVEGGLIEAMVELMAFLGKKLMCNRKRGRDKIWGRCPALPCIMNRGSFER